MKYSNNKIGPLTDAELHWKLRRNTGSTHEGHMNAKHPASGKVRAKRDGFLKARWEPELVDRFAKAAEAQGQTSSEVLRTLAFGFIRRRIGRADCSA